MRRYAICLAIVLSALSGAASTRSAPTPPVEGASSETVVVRLAPQDTFLNLDGTNYSTHAILATYTWPDYQVANAIVMKFDLSALPSGVVVENAVLRLALVESDSSADTYVVSAHKLLRQADIARATGLTADGVAAWTANACCASGVPLAQADLDPAVDSPAIDTSAGFKSWDITRLAQEWQLDPGKNFGVVLNSDASKPKDRHRFFASMEHQDPGLRPYLELTFAARDVTPPSVRVSAPAAGAALANAVSLAAEATDDVGVAAVQFHINGSKFGAELTAYPYALTWDTTAVSDGTFVLTAAARDVSGNTASSPAVTVAVRNGILFVSPEDTYLNINTTNYSRSATLGAYTWPSDKPANAILMRTDLSAIPPRSIVEEARLFAALVQSDTTKTAAYTIRAHKLLRPSVIARATGYTADGSTSWSATNCCYNGARLAQADISPAYASLAVDKTRGFKSWVITQLVQEWLADPSRNFGLLLNADTSAPRDRFRLFASMEHADPGLRPFLRIRYAAPPLDTTPPAVSITAPAPNATLAGVVPVTAGATDDVELAGVQFKLDGISLGAERTAPPYSVSWDTTTAAAGAHTLTAVARDAAGNRATAAIAVTVDNAPPPPPPPPPSAIASRYPGDVGIDSDPDVVFVERFDESSLGTLLGRWTDVLNGAQMTFSTDAPPGSPIARSLNIPWSSLSTGGHLYRQLPAGIDDTLYVRYYIKYPSNTDFSHHGVWMGGYNPPLGWPNPQAGVKPSGSDRFSAAAEQNTLTGRFDHYNYWMGMRQSGDGSYWGNLLLNDPAVQAQGDRWTCVEQMVKLNTPTSSNGEHAIWLDGVKVSHLGPGFPNGTWSGGIFTQDPAGTPFPGFQWRNTSSLNLNWLWLQVYATQGSGSFKYAHLVAAKSYIGCLSSAEAPSPWPNQPSGFKTISDQPWSLVIGNAWNYLLRTASKASDIVLDTLAPWSPSSVLRMIFTTDMSPDTEPGVHWLGLSNVKEIYTGWWMKTSPNWACSAAGCGKVTFLFTNGAGQVYTNLYHSGNQGAPYFIGANTEWAPYGQRIWTPNVTTTPINPGEWHRIEFYYRWETTPGVSGDGVIRWWVDGVLNGNYTNVSYPSGSFIEMQYAPTLQNPPTTEQYMYFDHTIVSVP